MSTHIIVVGGGPCGLLTALGLANAGSRVTIFESNAQLNDSPRAVAYHYPVLSHLEKHGILQDCIDEGLVRQDFAWRIHETGELIRWDLSCFDGLEAHPYAMHLHQGHLSKILEKHLAPMSNVDIRYSTKLVSCLQHDGGVVAKLTGPNGDEEIEGDFLVGADGASSTVRSDVLGYDFFGFTWPQRYVALNIYIDFEQHDFQNIAMQIDHEYGGVICKLADPNYWRITFMEDPALPIENLRQRIIEKLVRHVPVADYTLDGFAPYRMHQRVTDRMREGRILLVGDAAHVTNPTGGLGLTGGMFDSFALIEVLNRVIHDNVNDSLLDFYDCDRRRIFIEHTSPRASDNLRLMYYMKPGQAKDEWIEWARKVGKEPALMREAFSFTATMESKF
ncbi:MAG: 3-(3-hydroxy-phenyl)propionate hydroxylase [Gammaproteobacteria bacterium]|jgi:3-(3-hydroxy-phenyl)propionate hydroxylase